MLDLVLSLVFAIIVIAAIALAHKYHIDTRSTIDELSKDRKLYQRMAWQEIEARESFLKQHLAAINEKDATLKLLVGQLLEFKQAIESSKTIDDKIKSSILKRIAFADAYKNLLNTKDAKPLRNGSPPGIERRF